MGNVIEFIPPGIRHKQELDRLYLEMSKIIGDSEMAEIDDGDIILDSVSEIKCDEIQTKIRLEMMKMGYGDGGGE